MCFNLGCYHWIVFSYKALQYITASRSSIQVLVCFLVFFSLEEKRFNGGGRCKEGVKHV